MSFPSKLSEYNSLRYWECRYDEDYDDNYEWFQSAYDRFLEKCTSLLNNQDIALIIGCGNSKLGLDLSTKLADCLCIDFASNVIMKMNRKYQLQVTYLIMDMIFLTFRSDVFDTVIDKGSLDSICSAEKDSWNQTSKASESMRKCIKEIHRFVD